LYNSEYLTTPALDWKKFSNIEYKISLYSKKNSTMAGTSRREVIRTLALGGTGLLLSPLSCLSGTTGRQKKLKVALVGLGITVQTFLPLLCK
jgi:hypothetical protein